MRLTPLGLLLSCYDGAVVLEVSLVLLLARTKVDVRNTSSSTQLLSLLSFPTIKKFEATNVSVHVDSVLKLT